MKNTFFAFLLSAFLAGCAAAPAPVVESTQAGHTGACAPVGVMAKRLIADDGLAYLADAIDSNHVVHMWYVRRKRDERYGEWVEIVVGNNLESCIVREGVDWHFAAGG